LMDGIARRPQAYYIAMSDGTTSTH
jgi:hypothetical protein